jgi:TonB family protein
MPRMMCDFLRELDRVLTRNPIVILWMISFALAQPAPSSPAPQHSIKLETVALYAPPPKYPKDVQGYYPKGSGMVLIEVDKNSGLVKSAAMEKSTGNKVLDSAALQACRQWRFRPGTVWHVRWPVTFWHNGSGVRHRMAGAVISN